MERASGKCSRPSWLAALALLVAGCGTTLFAGSIRNQGDGWTVEVTEVRDGPNSYQHGSIRHTTEDDQRFIWVGLTLTNGHPAPRRFNFEACELDLGQQAALPSLVTHTVVLANSVTEKEITVGPGEAVKRYLAFSYPEDRLPTRFSCAGIPVSLPRL
jgi:hypothetical protein